MKAPNWQQVWLSALLELRSTPTVEDWMRAENEHLERDQPWTRATAIVSGGDPTRDDGTVRVAFT